MTAGAPFRFGELVATESVEARRVVVAFAAEVLDQQRAAFEANRRAGKPTKPVPSWEQCLAKSRETRRRREVHGAGQVARHHNI